MPRTPSRGEVWLADFDPTIGHEQAGRRPCLIVSDDMLNHSRAGIAVVIPFTKQWRNAPLRVAVQSPEGGLRVESFVITEAVRSISTDRLQRRLGAVTAKTMDEVEDRLIILFSL